MPDPTRPSPRNRVQRCTAVLISVALCLACQPSPGSGESPDALAEPFVAAAGEASPVLVFPPPPQSRPRGPSPAELTGTRSAQDDIGWPSLDSAGAFSFEGRTLSLSFNRPVVVPSDPSLSLTIEPPVAGKVEWPSPWSVQFVADDHFDPDQTYTLRLGALVDQAGKPVAAGFQGTFTARPAVSIAGKVINYFPEPGKPKLVALRPFDGARVGKDAMVAALFDQAVDLATLSPRIVMHVDGTLVDATLAHPTKNNFEGVTIDKGFVVEARPSTAPSPGSTVNVAVHGLLATDEPERVRVEVAKPLALNTVSCGWGSDASCKLAGGVLPLPDRDFTIELNNPIDMSEKQIARAIKISPSVRNLSVWSDRWSDEGRIHVSGDFAYSKTYHVEVGALTDRFGDRVRKAVSFDIVRPPQAASVAMQEGVRFIDAQGSRALEITTRNTNKATLALWEVAATSSAHQQAHARLASREKPSGSPDIEIAVEPVARLDASVTTRVNLLDHLTPGKTYLAMLQLNTVAFSAPPPTFPSWSLAALPPTALITPHDDDAVVMHAHASGGQTLVHVARLATGMPLPDATVTCDEAGVAAVHTDAQGLAVLDIAPRPGHGLLLSADHKGDVTQLSLDASSLSAGHFAPELTGGTEAQGDVRALVITDRGAYRPGALVRIKTTLRQRTGDLLSPFAAQPVRVRVVDPTGKEASSATGRTDAMGGFATDFQVGPRAAIGRYRVVLEKTEGTVTYAEQTIQVAEFEPPRFSVDVALAREADDRVAATVQGKYLFGAPMDGAAVTWTLLRADAPIADGSFSRRGLRFAPYRDWYDEESTTEWTRTGTGALASDGTMSLRQVVEMPADRGPQRFTLEAEVADASHRTIAGRNAVVLHPAEHYAGIKVNDHWLAESKAIPFEVGVIDHDGNAVSGKTIRVELTRERWVRTRKSGPAGSFRSDWHVEHDAVGSCTTVSAGTVTTCDLATKGSGDYRVTAFVDGKAGGSDYLWAWGSSGWDSGAPSKGRTLQVSTDKAKYRPGETATLIVANPFADATALVTVEDGTMVHRRAQAVSGRAATFEIEIPKAVDGPWVHATVTLLPRGSKGAEVADWKLGAVRIPLELTDVRLDVTAKSDREAYEPGQHVEIDIDVTRNGKPAANTEVVLAIVDEGVLRLTDHHAPDPVPAMHPGRPLNVTVDDNRRAFAEMLARSHTAGDGPGSGAQSLVGARKNFVRTALWAPSLKTDARGHVDVGLDLPDNLTRFRIMAVAVDPQGRGGMVEDGFFVRKSLMAQPAVPRFAAVGDHFEAAVMVHNNTDGAQDVVVSLGKQDQQVTIAAHGHQRVAFAIHATQAGERRLVFSIKDGDGVERDKVVATIPVQAPGVDERPRVAGSFVGSQQVLLSVPAQVEGGLSGDDFLTVTVGEQLWPELASRLEYLVDYPHGCVEQTTSSTVPLLAARTMLPRLGVTRWSTADLDAMIKAGVERLDTMRTVSGGLAYWPGGHEPNVYGTAYAMHAVVGAQRAGIEPPAGLLEGMRDYLVANVQSDSLPWGTGPEVRAAIALSLAEAQGLPSSAADALFDTKDTQGPFGLSALAIALSTLPDEGPRVATLLDALEASLDDEGTILTARPENEFDYFGSDTRTRALAAIALGRLRPLSTKLPGLVHHLLQAPEGYTTQSTAYALLSLTEHMSRQAEMVAAGRVRALIDGVPVEALLGEATPLGPGAMQYKVPLARVRGQNLTLRLEAESTAAVGFAVTGRWRKSVDAPQTLAATTGEHAPDVWRVVTDVQGDPVDLHAIPAGTTLRVVLLARLPSERVDARRMGYLALTDRLPAGFEALQPDLWTVASVPELSDAHPLHDLIRWGSEASHVELRDDRAQFYFDRVWGQYVHATYLMRATTPGQFSAAPATAELMYEADGIGYSEGLTVQVAP